VPLEKVANAVCEEFGCNQEQIITKGRKKNKAREVAIFIARDMTGITCKDLGEYFGGVSGALITMMHNRIADESKRNKRLKGRIDNIRNQIFKI
jgi:chromosomal replication initiation ATPase DnaA